MRAREALVLLPLGVALVAVGLPLVEIAGEALRGVDRTPLGAALWAPAALPGVARLLTARPVGTRRAPILIALAMLAALAVGVGILGHFQLAFSLLPMRYLPAIGLLLAAQVVGLGWGVAIGVRWSRGTPQPW